MLPRHGRYDYSPITGRKDYSWPGVRWLDLLAHRPVLLCLGRTHFRAAVIFRFKQ